MRGWLAQAQESPSSLPRARPSSQQLLTARTDTKISLWNKAVCDIWFRTCVRQCQSVWHHDCTVWNPDHAGRRNAGSQNLFPAGKMIHWGRLGTRKAARKKASLHVPHACSWCISAATQCEPPNIPNCYHKLSVLPTARSKQFKRWRAEKGRVGFILPFNSSRKAGGWKTTHLEELPVHFCIRNAYFIYFIHFIAMSGAEFPEWQCKSKVSEGLTKISSKKVWKLHINCFVNTCSDNGLGRNFMDCNPLRITALSVCQTKYTLEGI